MSTRRTGWSARTRYRVIERAGNRAAWVELQPLTGRTHQLRVHMAAIGHPIVGDGKYGGQDAFLTGAISRKMHLHARRLRIDHPDGGQIDVTAELPEHFAESLAALGFDPDARRSAARRGQIFRDARGQAQGRRRRRQVAPQGPQGRAAQPGARADASESPLRLERSGGDARLRRRHRLLRRSSSPRPVAGRRSMRRWSSTMPDRLRFHVARANRAARRTGRRSRPCFRASVPKPISAPTGTARPTRCRPGTMSRSSAEGPLRQLRTRRTGRACSTR